MSVVQYNRKVSLIVGNNDMALELADLRFTFIVRRGDTQTPNYADITVYNMAPATMRRIEKEFTKVVLQGGYAGNYGILFMGEIKQVRRGRVNATDTYLAMTVADGDRAYNYAYIATSLAAGSTPSNHIDALLPVLKGMDVTKGFIPDLADPQKLPRGKVMYGMVKDAMRNIAVNIGSTWSIQDGKLTIIPLNAYQPGEVPVINAATGMIGLPEQTANGIKVRILINPSIRIGSLVKLDNEAIQRLRGRVDIGGSVADKMLIENWEARINADGLYYVMYTELSGDTRGNEWYMDLTCLAVDATLVNNEIIVKQGVPSAGAVQVYP